MGRSWAAAALALWVSAPPAFAGGVQQASPDPSPTNFIYLYEQAKGQVSKWEGEVQRRESRVELAPNEYERLKALRELDAARASLRSAQRELDEARLRMRPGDAVWEREAADLRIPAVGAAGPVDPRAHQGHWVGSPGTLRADGLAIPVPPAALVAVPSPGAVEYGRPQDPRAGPAAAAGRWKERSPGGGAEGGPIEPEPPARRPDDRALAPPLVLGGVDFVGRELRWGFTPFGRGVPEARPESREERALIRGLEEKARFGDYGAALESARRLKDLRPEDPRSHLLEARVLNHLGRFREGRGAARRALELGLSSVELFETLAWAEVHLGLFEEAVRSADEAIRLDPASGLAYIARAFAYERLGRRDLREKDLRKAAALAAGASPLPAAAMGPGAAGNSASRPDDGFRLLGRRREGRSFPWPLAAAFAALGVAAGRLLRRRLK